MLDHQKDDGFKVGFQSDLLFFQSEFRALMKPAGCEGVYRNSKYIAYFFAVLSGLDEVCNLDFHMAEICTHL